MKPSNMVFAGSFKQLNRRRDQRRTRARSLGAQLFGEQPAIFKRRLKAAFRSRRASV
jgi:hypothetical protein